MLLDVGCGSGSFLQIAQSCGWTVMGVEPDPKAVAYGREQGLNIVQGSIELFEGQESMFDVITLSHVIEHVHDPVALLRSCHRLLKPNGQIWLETPNIDSLGHSRYGRDWHGLDPPRHLVLFDPQSLIMALHRAGFNKIDRKSGPSPLLFLTKVSIALRQGLPWDQDVQLNMRQKWSVLIGRFLQVLYRSFQEFLTVVSRKSE
jgi:SAM-dependent methyltransferase